MDGYCKSLGNANDVMNNALCALANIHLHTRAEHIKMMTSSGTMKQFNDLNRIRIDLNNSKQ